MKNNTNESHCEIVYIIISLLLAVDFLVDLLLIVKERTVFDFATEKLINFLFYLLPFLFSRQEYIARRCHQVNWCMNQNMCNILLVHLNHYNWCICSEPLSTFTSLSAFFWLVM